MEEHLNLYRIFYTVANTENISRAARQLFISQPSLSKALKKLESDLGVTLFIRSSRGVRLTEEGKLLYDYVREAFSSLRRARR